MLAVIKLYFFYRHFISLLFVWVCVETGYIIYIHKHIRAYCLSSGTDRSRKTVWIASQRALLPDRNLSFLSLQRNKIDVCPIHAWGRVLFTKLCRAKRPLSLSLPWIRGGWAASLKFQIVRLYLLVNGARPLFKNLLLFFPEKNYLRKPSHIVP